MSKKTSIISGFVWRFAERCGAQGVTLLVSVILARLLNPEVYGVVALITVFTSIMQVFVDCGLGNALIQKKNADNNDFSTVFYFNVLMCLLLYLIIFVSAPYIADFYNNQELIPLVRVLGLSIIVSGVKNVQQAYVSRNMLFKRFFFSTLGGTIGAAVLGIIMAVKGFGVWALVAQNLFNMTLDTLILWFSVKWRPTGKFSVCRLKILFSYGWKLLVSCLIDTIYGNIRSIVIGKVYTSNDLAFYNKGKQFPELLVVNINTSIDSVLLPAMSKEQDDLCVIKSMTQRAIKTSTFIIMPMMIGLAVCAEPIVSLVLTNKWLSCVFFMKIFSLTYSLYPINTANLNAIKAMGRSDVFLKLEVLKKTIGLTALALTMFAGVKAMAYSLLFVSVINQFVNAWPNKKLLNYSFFDQLKDIFPQTMLSIIMGAIVYLISFLGLDIWLTLIIQIISGILIYILLAKTLSLESYQYITGLVKLIRNNR